MMISVQEARRLIHEHSTAKKVEQTTLRHAAGLVLAKPVYSPVDTPPFDQSAMDGYAFSFAGWDGVSGLKVVAERKAGDDFSTAVRPSETVRIFTGAALPDGADTVVMQEKVQTANGSITITDANLSKGANVRLRASQTNAGELALPENHLLSPASVSFLSGLGVDRVKVFANPDVSLIVTGSELIPPGTERKGGEIYESNSFGLAAALNQININPVSVDRVHDDEEKLIEAISRRLGSDIILLTAGVSVGDYDFVAPALEKCGVEKLFHRIKQKPGKPLYFGKKDNTLVFGLPGNPASALTCFYEYVLIAIERFTQRKLIRESVLPLSAGYTKKTDFTFFFKGLLQKDSVKILNDQESYKMNSFAMADCLIELEEGKNVFSEGDMVRVRMI